MNQNFSMDQLLLGIGTRLQHSQHGPGVIVAVKYATYLVSFINVGVKEIDKTDSHLEEIFPENVSAEIETHSDIEKSLLKILQFWGGITENVPLGEKWNKGTMLLQPFDKSLEAKGNSHQRFLSQNCDAPGQTPGVGTKY